MTKISQGVFLFGSLPHPVGEANQPHGQREGPTAQGVVDSQSASVNLRVELKERTEGDKVRLSQRPPEALLSFFYLPGPDHQKQKATGRCKHKRRGSGV